MNAGQTRPALDMAEGIANRLKQLIPILEGMCGCRHGCRQYVFVNRSRRPCSGVPSTTNDSRITKNVFLNFLHDGGSRHAGDQRNGFHGPASGLDGFAADDFVGCPIAAFHEHVRSNLCDQSSGVRLIEEHDIIHAGQRGKHFGALLLRDDRSVGRLIQTTHGTVRIDAYNEDIAEVPCGLQVTRVADVHYIKTTVSKDNAPALRPVYRERGDQAARRDQFFMHGLSYPSCDTNSYPLL